MGKINKKNIIRLFVFVTPNPFLAWSLLKLFSNLKNVKSITTLNHRFIWSS